jgi:hypothetical protein
MAPGRIIRSRPRKLALQELNAHDPNCLSNVHRMFINCLAQTGHRPRLPTRSPDRVAILRAQVWRSGYRQSRPDDGGAGSVWRVLSFSVGDAKVAKVEAVRRAKPKLSRCLRYFGGIFFVTHHSSIQGVRSMEVRINFSF